MSQIVILGGGPSGLACGMELFKENINFILIEKYEKIGGLAKTYKFGEFLTDNGPHRFFSKNSYLYNFIEELLGEKWIKVDRYTRFYVDGRFYKYPVQLGNVLRTVPFFKGVKMFMGALYAKVRYSFSKPKNFEEYVVQSFGRPLAEFNMINYTEKIWGLNCSQLSADWAKQRIKGLGFGSLIKKLIFSSSGARSMVDAFYYPDRGTGLIYDAIGEKISTKNEVLTSDEPISVETENNLIKKVLLKSGKSLDIDTLVTSIPITRFLEILDPQPPKEVIDAVKNLKYRSQVYLFITLNRPSVTKDQWIYFPDADIPFGRVSEMKNFSKLMAPEDKTSLFIEFFCWKDDEIWNSSKEELLQLVIPFFERLEFFTKEEIIDTYHIKKDFVYPVYDLGYEENLGIIKDYLNSFHNLIYIGRPGRFKYTNQDHSLEMGIVAAKSIIDGKQYDLELIGSENEYFEEGKFKED